MSPLVWLAVAIVAGAGAYLVGWPVLRGYRARETRDLTAERYRAWRGRARSSHAAPSTREGMTGEERRRVMIAGALAVVAVASLIAFFATS